MSCDPSTLANSARCFESCIPVGMQPSVQTYLLCQLASVQFVTALSANLTLYVSPTGSDSNAGTSASPFATIQKAVDVASAYYIPRGVTVTIQLADGTYTLTSGVTCDRGGGGTIAIQGNSSTPSNVVITTSSAIGQLFSFSGGMSYTLNGFRLKATANTPSGLLLGNGGRVTFANLDFNTGLSNHIVVGSWSTLMTNGNYAISGGSNTHILAQYGGSVQIVNTTVTITGTPAFAACFLFAQMLANVLLTGNTYSGSATGQRYIVSLGSYVNSGVTLPGNVAGGTTTGGFYQ